MIVSTDAEKAFDKIQQQFMIKQTKTLNKLEIEGNFLSLIKITYKNPLTSYLMIGENQYTDPPILNKVRVPDGEGNGNPLQYSCLENPMDGGAW